MTPIPTSLIARLEQASEGSGELDIEIYKLCGPEKVEARLAKARKDLLTYGMHERGCPAQKAIDDNWNLTRCRCGLDAALKEPA